MIQIKDRQDMLDRQADNLERIAEGLRRGNTFQVAVQLGDVADHVLRAQSLSDMVAK